MSTLKVSKVGLNSSENTNITIASNDLDLLISSNGKTVIRVDGTNAANTLNVTGNAVVTGTVFANNFIGYGAGFQNMETFTTPGSTTWTIPSGVKRFKATVIGAGGSGGGSRGALDFNGGDGGGAGGLSIIFYNVVSGVSTVSLNVGQAGLFSTTLNANGSNGFASNINYNDTWAFGNGGSFGANVFYTSNTFSGLGGTASGGTLNIPGGSGSLGAFPDPVNIVPISLGGTTPLGYGSSGSIVKNFNNGRAANGANGVGYGSGGGGGRNGGASGIFAIGGAGANGIIIIEY